MQLTRSRDRNAGIVLLAVCVSLTVAFRAQVNDITLGGTDVLGISVEGGTLVQLGQLLVLALCSLGIFFLYRSTRDQGMTAKQQSLAYLACLAIALPAVLVFSLFAVLVPVYDLVGSELGQ